jgi:hypothetical protein
MPGFENSRGPGLPCFLGGLPRRTLTFELARVSDLL